MNTFTMYRPLVAEFGTHDENSMNGPEEPQFEGVVFTDGTVAIRWLTAKKSTSVWESLDDMLAIHGHPEYGSRLVWDEAVEREVPTTKIHYVECPAFSGSLECTCNLLARS